MKNQKKNILKLEYFSTIFGSKQCDYAHDVHIGDKNKKQKHLSFP